MNKNLYILRQNGIKSFAFTVDNLEGSPELSASYWYELTLNGFNNLHDNLRLSTNYELMKTPEIGVYSNTDQVKYYIYRKK